MEQVQPRKAMVEVNWQSDRRQETDANVRQGHARDQRVLLALGYVQYVQNEEGQEGFGYILLLRFGMYGHHDSDQMLE